VPAVFPRFLNPSARVDVLAPGPIVSVVNLGRTGLTLEWTITRTNTSKADTGMVRIHNLGRSYRRTLQQAQALVSAFNYLVTLSLGWDGLLFEAMTGPLVKLRAELREGPTGVVTELEFGDGVMSERGAVPAQTPLVLSDGFWLAAFKAIASTFPGVLGLAPSFPAVLATSPFAAQFPNFGAVLNNNPARDLDVLVSSLGPSYDWGIQDGLIVLYNAGLVSDLSPPQVLSPGSGLISWEIQDDGAVLVQALANPTIRPGQQVQVLGVDSDQGTAPVLIGGGPLYVESMTMAGSTGGESLMSVISRKIELF
jgi:hypothetical protein